MEAAAADGAGKDGAGKYPTADARAQLFSPRRMSQKRLAPAPFDPKGRRRPAEASYASEEAEELARLLLAAAREGD